MILIWALALLAIGTATYSLGYWNGVKTGEEINQAKVEHFRQIAENQTRWGNHP